MAPMKRGKSVNRRSPANAQAVPTTLDEYLAVAPEPARAALLKLRATILSVLPPEATETISYRMPAIKYKGMLVWYAAFANHCSLFPTASIIAAFKSDLKSFTTSKGTIQFPLDKPLPITLIKKLVKARVEQVEKKKRG